MIRKISVPNLLNELAIEYEDNKFLEMIRNLSNDNLIFITPDGTNWFANFYEHPHNNNIKIEITDAGIEDLLST